MWYEPLLDRGLLPDPLVRWGMRRTLEQMLAEQSRGSIEDRNERYRAFLEDLRSSPVAIETDAANEQHYEVPAEFFRLALGPRLKYSGCYWPEGVTTLADAEEAMLKLTCERAELHDGMTVLDLGCGWGSMSFWIMDTYPNCRVLAVSNSSGQRRAIEAERERRGYTERLEVVTADANTFDIDRTFDRIISVEMFEHMKNYRDLLSRLSKMLEPDGRLFVHIFTHRELAYHFESDRGWLAKHFFTGGTMPSDDLLAHFQDDVVLDDHWRVGGEHYQKTANAWLANMDARREQILPVLADAYGPDQARTWFNRWRVFFMACAESWGMHGGTEWLVSHYRFRPRVAAATRDERERHLPVHA